MIHRVLNDWTHWRLGNRIHFGFQRWGNCRVFALPRATSYFSGKVTHYSWWRMFFSVECSGRRRY